MLCLYSIHYSLHILNGAELCIIIYRKTTVCSNSKYLYFRNELTAPTYASTPLFRHKKESIRNSYLQQVQQLDPKSDSESELDFDLLPQDPEYQCPTSNSDKTYSDDDVNVVSGDQIGIKS